MRALEKRLERAEQMARAKGKVSLDCICFPPNEQPCFDLPMDEKIAARLKCPLHGERFVQFAHVYVARWLREKEKKRWLQRSEQFRKAWLASFPNELSLPEDEQARATGD